MIDTAGPGAGPDAFPSALSRTSVEGAPQVHIARSRATRLARSAGMSADRVATVALVVTELAENLHRHARGGEIVVLAPGQLAQPADRLSVLALDHGPGVTQFERCYVDGYSTRGTLGGGLGAVRRLSDEFDAASEPGLGTVVSAGFAIPSAAASPADGHFDVAALGFPLEAGAPNGDRFATVRHGSRLLVMLADGLGHGALAADASGAAVGRLAALADLAPGELVAQVDRHLTSSRGAAVTVASLDLDAARRGGTLRSAGLGNVSVLAVGPDGGSHRIATAHGTAGTRVSSRRGTHRTGEQSTDFPARGVLVLHTDGLTTRWTLDGRAELLRHTSTVIAATLWRDHARASDDSMIVVVKARPVPAS